MLNHHLVMLLPPEDKALLAAPEEREEELYPAVGCLQGNLAGRAGEGDFGKDRETGLRPSEGRAPRPPPAGELSVPPLTCRAALETSLKAVE